MKESQFTAEQIISVLKEAEVGANVQDLCRQHGISEATFYEWRLTHGGLGHSVAMRLKQLEEENRRLRSIVADLTLSNQALKRVVDKKW
jgi:putative transposase